eukprot:CAMPEP_0201519644 /NCGR_PEP_ID=MMETSP0161_2-20130828/10149_1 /ASSEMBLY_ACC=CAM_ASM_000251 /TAXON_ID=180227 /ORGANISM="Neoparamoeba aestuarina, Strain SoJaBio B1-5/56/2" /LENGTH=61 /DNA_ID=CAMNT_0047917751 /DNA_START=994 /DNA_END=1176 /DNA_ORIENTATION=+
MSLWLVIFYHFTAESMLTLNGVGIGKKTFNSERGGRKNGGGEGGTLEEEDEKEEEEKEEEE